jgi:competence protein ComEC
MSDKAAVLMALLAAAGALVARPLAWPLAAFVVAVGFVIRRPAVLLLGVALAASSASARAWAGLVPPESRPVDATVTLVADPKDVSGALRVDVRLDDRRVEAWARGRAAARLRARLAGERIHVTGQLEALSATERARAAPRHIAARLNVVQAGAWSAGDLPSRIANNIRRMLLQGASSLSPGQRSLFAGFVLGDDRDQPPEVAFDFRATGLTHLLVVSGGNVAFVLALAGPALRRLSLTSRLATGVAILLLFGTLTRWEPSVVRAVAMAVLALVAGALGRPASTLRLLALAVAGLLLVDPLLVHSIGFRLSVGACVGIALLAGRLAPRIPGPRPLAEAVAVTIAAQAGVAPVMVPVFGGLPVVTVLANILALPVAGALMGWGVAAGLAAGAVGGVPAAVIHLPTRLLVGWVAGVARVTSTLPFGHVGAIHVIVVAAAAAVAVIAARHGRRGLGGAALAACAAAGLLVPAWSVIRPPPVDAGGIGRGATLWRAGGASVVVLDGATGSPDRMMAALHRAGVRRLDVLVASRPTHGEARAAEMLQRRFPARVVLGPASTALPGALVPPAGSQLLIGGLVLRVNEASPRLDVAVAVGRGRGPPG